MADPTDTVPDSRDFGVVSNGYSSDNNSECSGQAAEDGEDWTGGNSGGAGESRDPDCVEERFRVDRKKLEEMLQAAQDGKSETGEEFFQRIMQQTDTRITWPSKLKIGAKSKKDPHIKVTGRTEDIAAAKEKIMAVLDTKSNRVTLKMDVSYTEHSHVIGKGGNIIKKVMHDTNCHIHFPDSNRGPQQEKSNQVSIAGLIGGVEQARAKIRELLPLVLVFELPISNNPAPDINSPTIQQIVQMYSIGVNMKRRAQSYSTTVTVRGACSNADMVKNGTLRLMEYLTGNIAMTLQVSTQIEITPQHHQFMNGRNGLNIKHIMQTTGARIHFPDPNGNGGGNNTQRKSSVFISGTVGAVIVARDLLMGCLPLVLMFDVKDEVELDPAWLARLMEKLDVFINVKPKLRQPSKSVIVKSIEKNAPNMYRARQSLLGQECESCAAHCGNAKKALNEMSVLLPGVNLANYPGIVNIASVNVHAMNSLNGLSRANALQTTQSSMGELPWQVVSQQNSRLTPGFPSNLTHVLVSHQTPNPLLIPQTQLPRHPNPNSPKPSNPTLNPHPNPSPNITPPLNPNPNPLLTPTTTPISQPHLAKLVTAPAHLTPGYVSSSTTPPQRSSTTLNAHPPTVSHTVHLQSPVQANLNPELLRMTPNNTQSNQPSYLHHQRASHLESNRLIRPNPSTANRRDQMSNLTLGASQTKSPPPGLVRADPMELQSLELAARQLIDSCRFGDPTENITQASHTNGCLLSPTKERVMSSSTSSSTSPAHSPDPCNSPLDLITMPTTCPINNHDRPKFMNLGCFPINASSSSSSSGSLSDALMGSGGRGSIMLMPDGTLGLTSFGGSGLDMRRSTPDSGNDVKSSDKRAPGCERREREREHEHAREDFESERRRSHEEKCEFDRLTLQSTFTAYSSDDYDQKKLLANKAMKRKPVVGEVQKPTDKWSGLGFSISMPESTFREQHKLNEFSRFDSKKLPTTYENSLKEDAERSTGESSWPPERSSSPEDLMPSLPSESQQANSLVAIGEYPANRRNKVAYANLSSSSYIEGATLPGPTKALWPSGENHSSPATKPELADLLINLGLGKYFNVFQQQEIDLSTFLTLTENDLKELGITTLGARRKMLIAISDMNKNHHKAFPFNASSSTTLRHEESKGPNNGLLVHSHYTPNSLWLSHQ